MLCRLTPLLLFLLAGCVTTQDQGEDHELQYACNDLVVVGRIATTSIAEHASTDPQDPLPGWLSEFGLQVRIKRVVRGTERRSVVPASSIAHGQIRGDRDFLVVLSPNQGNGFTLSTAALMSNRPKLREPCLRR